MANSDVINLIISTTANMMTYMLPVIATLAGLTFIISWFMSVTVGMGRRTFKG